MNSFRISLLIVLAVFVLGCLPSTRAIVPVEGATAADWHPQSFWYHPWGRSGTHKGIDIFARPGKPVLAAVSGLVLASGNNEMGSNYTLVLGAKWRLYYYAHLQKSTVKALQPIRQGQVIGAVGNTGNAQGKAPHLHFAIRSLLPIWQQYRADAPQAWNLLFYLDPSREFRA